MTRSTSTSGSASSMSESNEIPDDDADLDALPAEDAEVMRRARSDARAARGHERSLAQRAIKHVRPEHVDAVLGAYAAHVSGGDVPRKGQEDDHAHAFFAQYAKDNPEHARPAPHPL